MNKVTINAKGLARVRAGHPWIYKSDLTGKTPQEAGVVQVCDPKGKEVALAFFSPASQISIRTIASIFYEKLPKPSAELWHDLIKKALERRRPLFDSTNAYRVVFGEADMLPSVVIDRYNDIVSTQILSAGAESVKEDIFTAIKEILSPLAIVARNDVSVRKLEGLSEGSELIFGKKTRTWITENGLEFEVDVLNGQKTGAFLDQRVNRLRIREWSVGKALDCFCYQGWFACNMAQKADSVKAIDISEPAIEFVRSNAAKNGLKNIEAISCNAFDYLKENESEQFDFIHLDPPAFVKSRKTIDSAIRGYKEINLRAMKMLRPGGHLMTSSCSHHLSRAEFIAMLHMAAIDAKRRFQMVFEGTQDIDHPTLLSFPESYYLKTVVLKLI